MSSAAHIRLAEPAERPGLVELWERSPIPVTLRVARPTNDLSEILRFYVDGLGLVAAGYPPVPSFNPYWDRSGRTFEDPDGYRVVSQNDSWPA